MKLHALQIITESCILELYKGAYYWYGYSYTEKRKTWQNKKPISNCVQKVDGNKEIFWFKKKQNQAKQILLVQNLWNTTLKIRRLFLFSLSDSYRILSSHTCHLRGPGKCQN